MGVTITEGLFAAAFVGMLAYLAKRDRNSISEALKALNDSLAALVKELQEERKGRAEERHEDLARLSSLESQFSRLKGEHDAQIALGGHAHRRMADG